MSNRFNRTTRLRYAKFNGLGDVIEGAVIFVEDETVADFNEAGKVIGPKFDLNGELVKRPAITVRADNGDEFLVRAGAELAATIGAALATAGLDDLTRGDRIRVEFVGTEPSENEQFDVKLYEVQITRPEPDADDAPAKA